MGSFGGGTGFALRRAIGSSADGVGALPNGVFRHAVNGARPGPDFDVAPNTGMIGGDAMLIAQDLGDEPITFAPPPPIADQVRERLQLALIRVAS
jgi:hypothetical protein